MKQFPERPSLEHLKKQAKTLLALYKSGDPAAIDRIRNALPAAARAGELAGASLNLRLHDAQSCIAREYGFSSWADVKTYVEARVEDPADRAVSQRQWLSLVYGSDVAGGQDRARPSVAARMLEEKPDLVGGDGYVACAVGDEAKLRQMTQDDPSWINRPGGPLNIPPLVAVTHSTLLRVPAYREQLHACARFLLDAGADPDQAIGSRDRWAHGSLSEPSTEFSLSALYGAAGQNRDAELTKLLLDAGANPNDGESLYHSLESIACVHHLLAAGARINGTNALYRVLDLDKVDTLRLLLAHGADPNESANSVPIADWGSPLLWAIRRRRSRAHIEALLQAGANPSARTPDGASAFVLAMRFGLPEVAELLGAVGGAEPASDEERFIAACALGDEAKARQILSARPDLPAALSEAQLRLLPELAAQGCFDAVKLMVMLGWPIATPGGDWNASALNQAVFRGDAVLADVLLARGASWNEKHGYGDDVCGTLSFASFNEPVDGGDWLGCARALVAHGLPVALAGPEGSKGVIVDGRHSNFPDELTAFFLAAATAASGTSRR
jgi:hypothetical protein